MLSAAWFLPLSYFTSSQTCSSGDCNMLEPINTLYTLAMRGGKTHTLLQTAPHTLQCRCCLSVELWRKCGSGHWHKTLTANEVLLPVIMSDNDISQHKTFASLIKRNDSETFQLFCPVCLTEVKDVLPAWPVSSFFLDMLSLICGNGLLGVCDSFVLRCTVFQSDLSSFHVAARFQRLSWLQLAWNQDLNRSRPWHDHLTCLYSL